LSEIDLGCENCKALGRNRVRLKTFVHLNALWTSVYSIGFERRYVFTQPRLKADIPPQTDPGYISGALGYRRQ